jgi:dynein assembly factor 6, axonemal
MDFSSIGDISSLANLLKESQEKENESEAGQRSFNQPPKQTSEVHVKVRGTGGQADKTAQKPMKNEKDIWDVDELPTQESAAFVQDERSSPRYEINYKQIVGTEDVFLGMSDKSPSSSDCTHLVIKIHFPGSSMKELDLDVTTNRIKAESKTHRLFTYLPQSVDSANGKAKFDAKKEVLTVVLPIIKEY